MIVLEICTTKHVYSQTRLISAHVVQGLLVLLAGVLPSTFLFNARLYRKTCFCIDTRINFAINSGIEYTGIQRDTQGYTGIHVYPYVSKCDTQGYTWIHMYPGVSLCIPVSPWTSLASSCSFIYGRNLRARKLSCQT